MTFWRRQNNLEIVKIVKKKKYIYISGVPRDSIGEKRVSRQNIEDFQGCENTLCDTITMDTCHIHCPNSECTKPKMTHNVNYEHWVITLCQCRFINCNKFITLVVDVGNAGGSACGMSLCPQVCCEPKIIVLKN